MTEGTPIRDHLARPGPVYWDWRCLVCDQPCSRHIGWVAYTWERFFG